QPEAPAREASPSLALRAGGVLRCCSLLIVFQRFLELGNGVVDGLDGVDAMAAEVVVGFLQLALGLAQLADGAVDVRVPLLDRLLGLRLLLGRRRRRAAAGNQAAAAQQQSASQNERASVCS